MYGAINNHTQQNAQWRLVLFTDSLSEEYTYYMQIFTKYKGIT